MTICEKNPIFIGGVGGSGTRVVTEILKRLGYFMGDNLNDSNDYLEFVRLGKPLRELLQTYNTKSNQEISTHIYDRLEELTDLVKVAIENSGNEYVGWGWKTPPNFIILEYLSIFYSDMKYIHVVRNGLDMAYSTNQNQLSLWGFYFDIDTNDLLPQQASLKYWIKANKFALDTGIKLLGDRFHVICFEDLCLNTDTTLKGLLNFLSIENIEMSSLIEIISTPQSIGRHKNYNNDIFSAEDIIELNNILSQIKTVSKKL